MNIIGYDPAAIDGEFSKEVGLFKADLETLLKSSDYVSLHVPLLDSTKHMINAEKLALMCLLKIHVSLSDMAGIGNQKNKRGRCHISRKILGRSVGTVFFWSKKFPKKVVI